MKKIIKIILVILWMGVIFLFSEDNGIASSGKSEQVIMFIAKSTTNKNYNEIEKQELVEKYSLVIRKCAHFTEYAVLGLLVYLLLIEYTSKKTALFSILICMLYASTDEYHQLYIPGRSGQVLDILIDTLGSTVGILITNFISKKNMN